MDYNFKMHSASGLFRLISYLATRLDLMIGSHQIKPKVYARSKNLSG